MEKEFLGSRRRALEEEYFAELNRRLVERLRAMELLRARTNEGAQPARGIRDDEQPTSVGTNEVQGAVGA